MHELYERHVTWEEAGNLLFSGDYDNLTAREFKEKFPLKPTDEPVDSFSLRYRVANLIVREVNEYLQVEAEWQPHVRITHLDDKVEIIWRYPDKSRLPGIEIELREVANPNG
jgi:hypothetical protein